MLQISQMLVAESPLSRLSQMFFCSLTLLSIVTQFSSATVAEATHKARQVTLRDATGGTIFSSNNIDVECSPPRSTGVLTLFPSVCVTGDSAEFTFNP